MAKLERAERLAKNTGKAVLTYLCGDNKNYNKQVIVTPEKNYYFNVSVCTYCDYNRKRYNNYMYEEQSELVNLIKKIGEKNIIEYSNKSFYAIIKL